MEELEPWLASRRFATDEALAGPGAAADGLLLLLSGRASAYDAEGARLRQFSPGDAIRPTDALGTKAASVRADEPCRTVVLTASARAWLEQNEERLALKLYRYLLAGHFETGPEADPPREGEAAVATPPAGT